jgi:hypothetical protein
LTIKTGKGSSVDRGIKNTSTKVNDTNGTIGIDRSSRSEKLTIALTGPTAVIGAGLAEWSSSSKDD